MRAAIVYYSYTGNTKRACLFLMRQFNAKNIDIDLIELTPKNEETSFFKQGKQALSKQLPELCEVKYDMAGYDFVIFASPVWAFTFAPALRSYLGKITHLENKKTGFFLTYGSGLGKGKTQKELEGILREKKAEVLFSRNFSGAKTKDKIFLEEQFRPLLGILNLA